MTEIHMKERQYKQKFHEYTENSNRLLGSIATNTQRDTWIFALIKIWIPLFAGIAAVILGIVSLSQNERLSKSEQIIHGFDSLLRNTNSTLEALVITNTLLREQLELNRVAQLVSAEQITNESIGNRNKFIAAVQTLGSILDLWNKEVDISTDEKNRREYASDLEGGFIKEIENVLLEQMSNPYLNKNLIVKNAWNKAYKHIKFLGGSNVFEGSFSSDFYSRAKSPLDSIDNTIARDIYSCRISINNAYIHSARYIRTSTN
ncbi:MAG TPA: hypothetical protein VIN07_08710 [Flavipsychrobacter sp.]